MCSIVAISMAVSATLRSGMGEIPMPTRSRSVHARAAAAVANPDSSMRMAESR